MKKLYSKFRLLLLFVIFLQPVILISQTNQYLHFDKIDDLCNWKMVPSISPEPISFP